MQQQFPCPNCGSPNALGKRFCGACGFRLQYICPNCSTAIDNTFTVCPNCGTALYWPTLQPGAWSDEERGTFQEWETSYQQAGPELKKTNPLLKVAMALLVVVVLAGGALVAINKFSRDTPSTVPPSSSSPAAEDPADTETPPPEEQSLPQEQPPPEEQRPPDEQPPPEEQPPASEPGPPAVVSDILTSLENIDTDDYDELHVAFTLMDNEGQIVTANGKVTYRFLFSPLENDEEMVVLTRERQISDGQSDLPVYFQHEDFEVTCPICGGAGFLVCDECGGTGYIECSSCDGTGELPDESECPDCGGMGEIECPSCGGFGELECPNLYCYEGTLSLSGEAISLVIEFQREDGVTMDSKKDSIWLP